MMALREALEQTLVERPVFIARQQQKKGEIINRKMCDVSSGARASSGTINRTVFKITMVAH